MWGTVLGFGWGTDRLLMQCVTFYFLRRLGENIYFKIDLGYNKENLKMERIVSDFREKSYSSMLKST
jgi:hypothetical protein